MKKVFATVVSVALVMGFSLMAIAGPNEDLVDASKKGDAAKAKAAIDAGAKLNELDAAGNPPLFYAVFWPEITQMMLDKGADPNLGNYPALVSAANGYSIEVMKLLLAKGADPNKPQVSINDPAAMYKKMVEAEKAKGKAANASLITVFENMVKTAPAPTKNIVSPLRMVVGGTNCVACVDMLLKAGAKADEQDPNDVSSPLYVGSLLHSLAIGGDLPETRAAGWKTGAPAMEKNYGIKIPDWLTNLQGDRIGTAEDMMKLLVAKGLNVNEANKKGSTPLSIALYYKKSFIAKALIALGADPKITAKVKFPKSIVEYIPICQAAEAGDVELMKLMLDKGCDINANGTSAALSISNDSWGGDGYTPLNIAIMSGKPAVAAFLVDRGADINIGTNGYAIMKMQAPPQARVAGVPELECNVVLEKKTPIYWAIENGDLSLINKIGEKMLWKYNSFYKINIKSGGKRSIDGSKEYKCTDIKSPSTRPSQYADDMGKPEVGKLLMSKGL